MESLFMDKPYEAYVDKNVKVDREKTLDVLKNLPNMNNPLQIIHYGMEPYCERVTIDAPFPVKITLKKEEATCEHCIRKMLKNKILKKEEKEDFDKKRTRTRDRSRFKNKVD